MSSIDRLHKFAELICQALPDFDPASLSPRPLDDPSAATHVGWLRTRDGAVRVLFATSGQSDYVPMALVTCEDTEAAISLGLTQEFVGDRPAPPVGTVFDLVGAETFGKMGVTGLLLLKPGMLSALSAFEDGIANGGETFAPRLGVYLNASDVATARADLPALMDRFNQSGRSVVLSRTDFA